jgi:membrane-associated phospholipid phosphatase
MAAYILLPTRQDLRPTEFPRDNFLTQCVQLLYALDTNTGVCPSLHVAYSLGIASTWLREKTAPRWLRAAIALWCGVICVSVVFVKQHSVLDGLAALPICLAAELFLYQDYYKAKRHR